MVARVVFLLSTFAYSINGLKFVDQISRSTISVLHGSQRSGLVRQCTCDEMTNCYDSSKQQAIDCFSTCWNAAPNTGVTNNPAALKKCFDHKQQFITDIINCFKQRIRACAETLEEAEKKQVTQYDYKDMLKRVQAVIDAQLKRFVSTITSPSFKNVVDAAADLGRCVKTCFIQKNHDGFCFDKIPCQPDISDHNAKAAIHVCARKISWKTEIGQLCQCSSQAGVGGISDYCGMLRIMG